MLLEEEYEEEEDEEEAETRTASDADTPPALDDDDEEEEDATNDRGSGLSSLLESCGWVAVVLLAGNRRMCWTKSSRPRKKLG
jgi:hypothetical protein